MIPNLLDMPEKVLFDIIEFSGFRSIFALRKVSHDLRNFIDEKVPDVKFTSLVIHINPTHMTIYYDINRQSSSILFIKHQEGCLVKHDDMEQLLKNADFMDVFFKDFEIILNHQKSKIDFFRLILGAVDDEEEYQTFINPILLRIQNILKTKNQPLKVRTINLDAFKQDHVLAIVPYIDPKLLEIITFRHPSYSVSQESEEIFQIDRVVELAQWKNAKFVKNFHLKLSPVITDFLHFKKVCLAVHTVSTTELQVLREKMLNPLTVLEEFDIVRYEKFSDEPKFLSSFGVYEPIGIDNLDEGDRKWIFRIPNNKGRLEILNFVEQQRIVFYRKTN